MFYISSRLLWFTFLRLYAVFWYFYSPFLWDCVPCFNISMVYISFRLSAVFWYFSGKHFFEIVRRICIFLWFTFLWDCLPYLDISPPEANKCRPICHQGPPVHLPPCKELHRRKQIYKSINEKNADITNTQSLGPTIAANILQRPADNCTLTEKLQR